VVGDRQQQCRRPRRAWYCSGTGTCGEEGGGLEFVLDFEFVSDGADSAVDFTAFDRR
jgi:hypothetical protein